MAKETILDKIVARKYEEVASAKKQKSLLELQRAAETVPPRISFLDALANARGIGIIAEIKKASPSAGVMRADFDPANIAKDYHAGEVDCISVLTDRDFFQGSLEHLESVAKEVETPLLRKDFVVDEYQLVEAKIHGASAALFIAEVLLGDDLAMLVKKAIALGLEPLVELYEPQHLARVLACGTRLVGINNRDLRTFETRLEHTLDLLPHIGREYLVVSESGIKTPADVRSLRNAGARAILVGETFMRSPDIRATLEELRSGSL